MHDPSRASRASATLPLILTLTSCAPAAPAPEAIPASGPGAVADPPPQVAVAPTTTAAAASADPYHPAPRDTVESALYRGWQQYSVHCARCHGEDAQGSSFAPSLLMAMRPDGNSATREQFLDVLVHGRTGKGMPTAAKIGIDSTYFDGLWEYLKGRSDGRYHGGRPARRETVR